ncbi:RNA 2',3'-cyclic phosphodiesterase [Streptomyces sp. NPDC001380]|uniref:RNA 2',3'-cyclic phosphodiesterase n=1 Tax=Streptomyces sp. NPDC001380 TaxID=3364566 RepID=UPI0036A483FD
MRLFVAVTPPRAALAELDAEVRALRAAAAGLPLRWTEPDSWHLTLAFLGEVPEEALPDLEERLARAARRHEAHRLSLAGGGRFGDRALWAGVRGDTPALRRLAASVQAAARRAGAPAADDDRPYRAHLTLARSSVPRGAPHRPPRGTPDRDRPDLRALAAELAGFRGTAWEAVEVQLVRSLLGAGPARYTVLRSWPLGRPPAGEGGTPE